MNKQVRCFGFVGLILASSLSRAESSDSVTENRSELGLVLNAGNSESRSVSAKHSTLFRVSSDDSLKAELAFLQSEAQKVKSAENWKASLRYDRVLSESFSLFAAQTLQGDVFAGYKQRFDSDVGSKYLIISEEALKASAEAGYRYTVQNLTSGAQTKSHFLRLASELQNKWNDSVESGVKLEVLPNLSETKQWELGAEASVSVLLNSVLSLKSAYELRYAHTPRKLGGKKTDSVFTTSLVAKF